MDTSETINEHVAAYWRIKSAAEAAPTTAFAHLPPPAQKALAFYMAVDGEAWVAVWEHLNSDTASIDDAMPWLIEHYGSYPIKLFDILTADLKIVICDPESDLMIAGQHNDWEVYHAWYMTSAQWSYEGRPRGKPAGSSEIWPVLLDFDNADILQDGWHRFNQYAAEGLDTVPCLHFPDDSASRAIQRTMGSST